MSGHLVLSTVMDAIASAILSGGAAPRAVAWPEESIDVPCAVVGYPEDIDFDVTFQTDLTHGADEATFPVWFVVGEVTGKASRDALSANIAGATSVKALLDGTLSGAVQICNVARCRPDQVTIGGITYLAARYDLEVTS